LFITPNCFGGLLGWEVGTTGASWHTRSMYQTPDIEAQGQLFNEIAELVEKAKLRSTLTNPFSPFNPLNFRTPHAQIKSGRS
jgi:hypothetical protein